VKRNTPKNPRKTNFLRIPSFPGGKEAYKQFIKENIVYPDQALLNRVEGFVHLAYTVDNIGEIGDIEVTRGIGSGCDEEAIRVIKMMKYEPARNRGVRMKAELKTRIQFVLPDKQQNNIQPGIQLNYLSTNTSKQNSPEPKPQAVYTYIIDLGSSQG
jgi:TonB family protein